MYSLKCNAKSYTNVKGIQKRYVKKHVRQECFLEVLKNISKTTAAKFRTFVSSNHTVRTVEITILCLSAMDDKRYVLDDGLHTLA